MNVLNICEIALGVLIGFLAQGITAHCWKRGTTNLRSWYCHQRWLYNTEKIPIEDLRIGDRTALTDSEVINPAIWDGTQWCYYIDSLLRDEPLPQYQCGSTITIKARATGLAKVRHWWHARSRAALNAE